MEIRFAAAADLDRIVSLWKTCFGDEDDYPARFALRCIRTAGSGILLGLERDELLGMACAVGVTLRGKVHGAYLYAVCTSPKHRGKGVCTALLRRAKELYAFCCLIPAKESLHGFYRAHGFTLPLTVPVRFTADAASETLCPDLTVDGDYGDLIEEALACAPEDGFSEKKGAQTGKVYEIDCYPRPRSVIMEESGLCTPHELLEGGMLCAPLPI